MIDKERQIWIQKQISQQKGQKYPCSNQIVGKFIILKNQNRLKAFEQAYPYFVCYRRSKDCQNNRYINSRTEELWKVIVANENSRGYRFYKAIIDSTIDEDMFNIRIFPYISHYCCDVQFF